MIVEGSRLPADLLAISSVRAVHVNRDCDRAEDTEWSIDLS
jgi:hypothetical protein